MVSDSEKTMSSYAGGITPAMTRPAILVVVRHSGLLAAIGSIHISATLIQPPKTETQLL